MKCPYCLSDIEEEANVCKVCTRDLYLFKPMMAKIATLEEQLQRQPDTEALEHRILLLEQQLENARIEPQQETPRGLGTHLLALAVFILLPLGLLLFAHWQITVVYDAKLIYLRLISIALPLPFGFFLFAHHKRSVWPWFVGTCVLAIASVIGMSWITSLVDQTPILPQNYFEWREYLEYAASVSFSFLTGMLLGGIVYARKHRPSPAIRSHSEKAGTTVTKTEKSFMDRAQQVIELANEHGSKIVALGSTLMSIYTGLKGFMDS